MERQKTGKEKAMEEQRKQLKRVYAAQLLHLQEIADIVAVELVLVEVKEISGTNKSMREESLDMEIFEVYILGSQEKECKRKEKKAKEEKERKEKEKKDQSNSESRD